MIQWNQINMDTSGTRLSDRMYFPGLPVKGIRRNKRHGHMFCRCLKVQQKTLLCLTLVLSGRLQVYHFT